MTNHEATQEISGQEIELPTLGQFLTQCRQIKGWSMSVAARKIGISAVYLGRIEKDQIRSPGLIVAYDIAKNYGVDIDTLAEVHERQEEKEVKEKIRELERKVEKDKKMKLKLDLDKVSLRSKKIYLELLSSLLS